MHGADFGLPLPIGASSAALPFPFSLIDHLLVTTRRQIAHPQMKLPFLSGMIALASASALLPFAAKADPCEGPLPSRPGETFSGIVRYVGDGDGLCVGATSDPSDWIEVRLSDFNASELNNPTGRADRDRLSDLVLGRWVECVAVRGRNRRVISYDRVIASCRLDQKPIGDLLREAGGLEGGR